jgi:hypothetical protein
MKSYRNSAMPIESLVSDIFIVHYDLNKVPIRKISCESSFPVSISGLGLSANEQTPVQNKFTAVFSVNEITIEEPDR